MPGVVMEIAPKRNYDFDDLANAANLTCDVVDHVDVSQWCEGTLMVNVHSNSVVAGAQIDVLVVQDGFTAEDPSATFTGATLATITIDENDTAPVFVTQAFSTNFGSMLKVQVKGSQDGSPVACNAELSIRLSLKSCN